VCIFQGRAEFIEKYYEVVRDLRARGFAVATFDWRGQGLSQRALKDPRKGHVGSFAEFAIDLETFMKEVVLPDCPPPLFALAHSMGAAVLIQAAAKGHRWFDRMVLTAPMIRLAQRRMYGMAPALARIVRFAGRGGGYVPGGGPAVLQTRPFPGNPLTGDPVRYARAAAVIETEPALGLGSPTVGWADAAFRAADQAMQVHGGYGYTTEYHVERYWRDLRLFRTAPVSQEMTLNYIAEHVLGLPKSYGG